MEFSWQNKVIQLQGHQSNLQQVSMSQLRRMQSKGVVSSMFQNTLLQEEMSIPKSELRLEVPKLLQEFEDIFMEPKALPPHRALDHEIHMLPNSVLVNFKPFRYPYFQKGEIEK